MAIFVLVVVVAALVTTNVYFATQNKSGDKPDKIVKVTANSSAGRVTSFFKNRTTIKKSFSDTIFSYKGTELDSSTVYAGVNAKTAAQKKAANKFLVKKGVTITKRVCYNMYSSDKSWSMGYCVDKSLTELYK